MISENFENGDLLQRYFGLLMAFALYMCCFHQARETFGMPLSIAIEHYLNFYCSTRVRCIWNLRKFTRMVQFLSMRVVVVNVLCHINDLPGTVKSQIRFFLPTIVYTIGR